MEHGRPKDLQHDQGCEFKGAVERLMASMKVKVIQSSPYHPQSQGKVKRMHRALRKKILYDLINIERRGVNLVSYLPKYAQVLNEDPKQLGWMTPFHVYYGHKSNNILLAQCTHPSPDIIDYTAKADVTGLVLGLRVLLFCSLCCDLVFMLYCMLCHFVLLQGLLS